MLAYRVYAKFIDLLSTILDYICMALMLVMVGVVFYQVIMRQIFDDAPVWGEEVSLIIMCWFVYLGIAVALKEDLHIGIGMLVSRLPRELMLAIEVLVSFIILFLSALLYHFGTTLATFVQANSLPATGTSVSIFYFPVAVAGVLMMLIMVLKIAKHFVYRRESLANDH